MIAGVLLAAGASHRFGGQKLLTIWRGQPLLTRAAQSMLNGALQPVVVVLPPGEPFREALGGLDVAVVENPEVERGISHSIALGIGALPAGAVAALLAVADQPLMDEHVIEILSSAYLPGSIVSPRYGSHTGNPRIFDRRFFLELSRLKGDTGGHEVAAAHPEAVIECRFPERVGLDIDRPEDLGALPG